MSANDPLHIAILGASGFLGTNLCTRIISDTSWNVHAIARNRSKLERIGMPSDRLSLHAGDVLKYDSIRPLLEGIDVAYYFIHLMGHKERDFYEAELDAAHTFARAAKDAGVRRVVYMGGLGDNSQSESKHLHSRHRTGEILRSELSGVIELRASMIISEGSVAFDIIQNVARKLPVIVLPTAADTKTQPITKHDALKYLLAAATVRTDANVVIDIGGPEVLSYADIYRAYAASIGKRPMLLKIPYAPPYLIGRFLDLVTPKIHARIGAIMAESMNSEMTIQNDNARKMFPGIRPDTVTKSFEFLT